jgi:hypothetical protein
MKCVKYLIDTESVKAGEIVQIEEGAAEFPGQAVWR